MTTKRPYLAHHDDGTKRLVVGSTKAQVMRHVTEPEWSKWDIAPASAMEVASLVTTEGIPMEDATQTPDASEEDNDD